MRRGDDGWDDEGAMDWEGERRRYDADGLFDEPKQTGTRTRRALLDRLPDPRDGLTRVERVVLWQLDVLQRERRGRDVPTVLLFGRVSEHVADLTESELNDVLVRLGARGA